MIVPPPGVAQFDPVVKAGSPVQPSLQTGHVWQAAPAGFVETSAEIHSGRFLIALRRSDFSRERALPAKPRSRLKSLLRNHGPAQK